jgi:hypothetical protein
MRPWRLLIVPAALLGAAPGLAEPAPDELEANRRLLERWRADPEHYQRLQHDLRAFWALPPARQQRLRDLDRRLHEADPAIQARLWAVLQRYHTWLEELPEPDRQAVLNAPDPAERLHLIKEIRAREWIDGLPAGVRIRVLGIADPQQRAARIAFLRKQERKQRRQWQRPPWQRGLPAPRPRRLAEFPADVRWFVRDMLEPRLSEQEMGELKAAQGKWPQLPRTIAQLAAKYPAYPAPVPAQKAVTDFRRLPVEYKRALGIKGELPDGLKRQEGKWPDFALAVLKAIPPGKWEGVPPLGPSRPAEFPPAMRAVVEANLKAPLFNEVELKDLQKLEGRWPDYPRRLIELARRKHLVIPGMSLPGPRELWEEAWRASDL